MSLLSRAIEPKYEGVPPTRFSSAALKGMIVPLLIEQFLQMIVGLADTLMVSYAGEATVSGVSLDAMIYAIFIYVFTAISSGAAVVVSQYIGHGDRALADRSASQAFFIAGAVSLTLTALMLALGRAILQALYGGVEPAVMEASRTYLRIVTLSFPANAIYNAGAAIYRSMGKTRTTMFVSLATNLLNVIGNAIGIFVFRAGAAGVAWPTTISWYCAALVMTALCFRRANPVSIRLKLILRPDGGIIRRILHIAIPNGIENGVFQISKVVLGTLVATFGTAQIAANGIGQSIWSIAALISIAMAPAYITVIGQCMGAGAVDEADYYLRKLTRLTFIIAFLWNALILAATPFLLRLYDVSDETKRLILIIVVIHNLFAGTMQPISSAMSTGLRAAGDVRFAMYSALFCSVLCRVAFSVILGVWLRMGVVGIACAMVLDWTIKAALTLLRYRSGKWKRFKVI